MKKLLDALRKRGRRDKHPGILKGGVGMFKKLLNMVLFAALLMTASSLAKPAYAGSDTCNAYIVLTCSVTLSVSLVTSTTGAFMLGNVSAGTTVYSSDGVVFRNDSTGAVCCWDLNIDTNTLNGWTLANTPALNQVAIFGVFQQSQNQSNYDMSVDSFSAFPKTYNAVTGVFACGSYAGYGAGAEGRIIPYLVDPLHSDRKLCIKMLTPTAVTDQIQRTISITVTAKMAG